MLADEILDLNIPRSNFAYVMLPSLTEHVPFTRLQQKKNANLSLSTQTVNFSYFSRRVIFDSCFVIDFLEGAN